MKLAQVNRTHKYLRLEKGHVLCWNDQFGQRKWLIVNTHLSTPRIIMKDRTKMVERGRFHIFEAGMSVGLGWGLHKLSPKENFSSKLSKAWGELLYSLSQAHNTGMLWVESWPTGEYHYQRNQWVLMHKTA
jgi:hypothetical protein